MAFNVPTLQDVIRNVENNFSTNMVGSVGFIRFTFIKILARVFALAVFLPMKFIVKAWNNLFVSTCDVDGLVDEGLYLGVPHKPETFASGFIDVTLSEDGVIAANTEFYVGGNAYSVVSDVESSSKKAKVFVRAKSAGSSYNVSAGAEATSDDDNVESALVSEGGIVGGNSVSVIVNGVTEQWGESVDEYRQRLLQIKSAWNYGGSALFYKTLADKFEFVKRLFVDEEFPGKGKFVIWVVGRDTNGYISSSNLSAIDDVVNNDHHRTICQRALVCNPTSTSISVEVTVPVIDNDMMGACNSALERLIESKFPGDSITLSEISNALRLATGRDSVVCTRMLVDGSAVVRGSYTLSKSFDGVDVSGEVFRPAMYFIEYSQG